MDIKQQTHPYVPCLEEKQKEYKQEALQKKTNVPKKMSEY